MVQRLLEQAGEYNKEELPVMGRPWEVSFGDYQMLQKESEYAAWTAAHGFKANHFTVFVNTLKTFKSIQELNQYLKESGFKLNEAGGEIKGSPQQLLEQSSTIADQEFVNFSGETQKVPGCYYEFARRYPAKDGTLFQGFITESADKIFESTDNQGEK